MKIFKGWNIFREEAECAVGRAGFEECRNTGVTESGLVVVKGSLLLGFEFSDEFIIGNFLDETVDLNCREGRHDIGNMRGVIDPEDGGGAGREVNVTGFVLDHGLEEEFDTDVVNAVAVPFSTPHFGKYNFFAELVYAFNGFFCCGLTLWRAGDGVSFLCFFQYTVTVGCFNPGTYGFDWVCRGLEVDGVALIGALEFVTLCREVDTGCPAFNFPGNTLGPQDLFFQQSGDPAYSGLLSRAKNKFSHDGTPVMGS